MDGSRLLNAAVGLGVPVKELAKDVESVSFCFSKVVFSDFLISGRKLLTYCSIFSRWAIVTVICLPVCLFVSL